MRYTHLLLHAFPTDVGPSNCKLQCGHKADDHWITRRPGSGHLPLVSLNLIANPHADRHPEGSRMPREWRRAACVSKT